MPHQNKRRHNVHNYHIYIYNIIPNYNFGIKKKTKYTYTTQTWSFFTRCIHGKKTAPIKESVQLAAAICPELQHYHPSRAAVSQRDNTQRTLPLKHCCTRKEQHIMTYTYLPILTRTSSAHVGTIAIYPG